MNYDLLLDMDGILSDFVGGVCSIHKRPTPYTEQSAMGVFDMEKLWGISATKFWEPINNNPGFWYGLEKTKEADDLVILAESLFGCANTAVLTAPSMEAACVPGKRNWLKRHYPQIAHNIIFTAAKGFISGPNKVLVDDKDKNVEEFAAKGGIAILMPRLWNSQWRHAHESLLVVEEQLRSLRSL